MKMSMLAAIATMMPALVQAAQTGPSSAVPVQTLEQRGIRTIADALAALDARQKGLDAPHRGKAHGPIGNPGQYFGPDAYPAAAIRAGEQGRVVAHLSVGIDGKVTSCAVETSSGSKALDEATCQIALHQIVYRPATDRRGKPIAGTTTLPVRWVLPEGGPLLPPNASISIQLTIAPDGTIEACDSEPAVSFGPIGPCAYWAVGRKVMAPPTRDGRPVKADVSITSDIATVLDP